MKKILYNKHIEDGKVAVLYSPGYGAGWWTWNSDYEFLIFDARLVKLVLENRLDEIDSKVKEILDEIHIDDDYRSVYTGGAEDLQIAWILKGEAFEIREYDGYESVIILSQETYLIA